MTHDDYYKLLFQDTKPIDDSPTVTGDPAFRLAVGEGCRIRQEYVERIPEGVPFKVMWTRVDQYHHQWLDSTGQRGTVSDEVEFSEAHWERA